MEEIGAWKIFQEFPYGNNRASAADSLSTVNLKNIHANSVYSTNII